MRFPFIRISINDITFNNVFAAQLPRTRFREVPTKTFVSVKIFFSWALPKTLNYYVALWSIYSLWRNHRCLLLTVRRNTNCRLPYSSHVANCRIVDNFLSHGNLAACRNWKNVAPLSHESRNLEKLLKYHNKPYVVLPRPPKKIVVFVWNERYRDQKKTVEFVRCIQDRKKFEMSSA